MRLFKLTEFNGGWFAGNFSPSIININECEVAIKRYKAGDSEPSHYHKLATELTVVVSGIVAFNGIEFYENDIILIEKEEAVLFHAATDAITCVVKCPSIVGDKYVVHRTQG